jgi:tetratricopeptide (TPR) repeat protein
MKAKDQSRFNIDALRDLAGDKVFARGETYHRDGQVQILTVEPKRVLAQVAGSEDYRTELAGRGTDIRGHCSCPAFHDWGFCKHMVAVALVVNALGPEAEAEGAGVLSRIRDHLKQKSVDALVGIIMELAERDPALLRRLDVAAAVMYADDGTLRTRLRKAIDAATRTPDYLEYGEVPDWASSVDASLEAIDDLVSGPRAGLALELAEYAIDRIERAIDGIDDSEGLCSELLHHARDIHLAATESVRPDPVQLARDLFAREVDGDYGTFGDAAQLYAGVLGEPGLAEYNRLAVKAWEKLPKRGGSGQGHDDEFSAGYERLKAILDFFAERAGDVDTRIALRAHDLSSAWRYLQLAQFCQSQGRVDEALRRAEEGLWVFEDGQPDERLVSFTVELLSKTGRKADAEALLWRAFEKAPSLELYKQLRKLGDKTALERIIGILETRSAGKKRAGWYTTADLLVSILIEENMFNAAWPVARKDEVSFGARIALADASKTKHPREALEVYAERVNQFVNTGGNHGYGEAAKLIARMAALQSAAEQAAYVATLKARHGQKRNFMKLLG